MDTTQHNARSTQVSQEQLQLAIDVADLGTWELDLATDSWPNRSLRHDQMFGYQEPQAQWSWTIATRHVLGEDKPLFREGFTQALETGRLACEVRVRWPDGTVHWIASRGRTFYDESGRPMRLAGVVADITARKAAQEALRRSEEHFRAVVNLVPDLLWSHETSGQVDWYNERWCEYTGQSESEGLGEGWLAVIHPEDLQQALVRWRQALNEPGQVVHELRIRRHDGLYRWHLIRAEPLGDGQGRVVRWFCSATDIQEQHSARELLETRVHQRTQELRAILDSAASAIIATDLSGHITAFNPAAEAMLRLPAAKALGTEARNFFDPAELQERAYLLPQEVRDHAGELPPDVQQALQRDAPTDRPGGIGIEWTLVRADGTRLPALLAVSVLRDGQRQPSGFLNVITDLSDRRTLEDSLRQCAHEIEVLAAREKAIVASAATAVIAMDLRGRVTAFNPAAVDMFRLPAQQALGQPVMDLCDSEELRYKAHFFPQDVKDNAGQLPPEFQQGLHADIDPAIYPAAQRNEWTYWRADGTSFPGLLSISVLRDEAGQAIGFLAVIADLTERKAMEDALRRRTAELETLATRERAIVACAGSAIIATDSQGRITLFNPAAERLMGYSQAQALGQSATALLFDAQEVLERQRQWEAAFGCVLGPGDLFMTHAPDDKDGEWHLLRRDGTRVAVLLEVRPLPEPNCATGGLIYAAVDLSERKALEEQLLQRTAQAEAANQAKTTFLANMSHEIRTPLNAVIGLSHLLEGTNLDERQQRFVRNIIVAGEQLMSLVNDILDLSKIEAGEKRLEVQPFDLPELLQQVRMIVEGQAVQKKLQSRFVMDSGLPQQLCGDAMRIKQVLTNLMSNAVKFTEAGSVTLCVRQVAPLAPAIPAARPRVGVLFEVTDTGIGIPPDKQAAIFQPFTQADTSITRRFGGTGLGLSIVRRLVDMMGGRLEVHSTPSQGSTFSVMLTLALPQS